MKYSFKLIISLMIFGASAGIGIAQTTSSDDAVRAILQQILDVRINVEGPLATAWAPFTIALDGEMKPCGVNHFTLMKIASDWKVAYLIDTHTPDKCPVKSHLPKAG